MSDMEKLEKKIDNLTNKIHDLSIKVETKIVSQNHLEHRIEKLERNQYFVVTAIIGGIIKLIFDFIQGK